MPLECWGLHLVKENKKTLLERNEEKTINEDRRWWLAVHFNFWIFIGDREERNWKGVLQMRKETISIELVVASS